MATKITRILRQSKLDLFMFICISLMNLFYIVFSFINYSLWVAVSTVLLAILITIFSFLIMWLRKFRIIGWLVPLSLFFVLNFAGQVEGTMTYTDLYCQKPLEPSWSDNLVSNRAHFWTVPLPLRIAYNLYHYNPCNIPINYFDLHEFRKNDYDEYGRFWEWFR